MVAFRSDPNVFQRLMTNRILGRVLSTALLAITILSLSGCLLGLEVSQHLSGSKLPDELPVLKLGATREQVMTLLGPPPDAENPEQLVWTETHRPSVCRLFVLGVIPLGGKPLVTRRVEATFVGDRLADATVTYRDRRGRVTSSESLIVPRTQRVDDPRGLPHPE